MPTNANSSTTSNWLKAATRKLDEANVPTARLDCLVLLEDAIGKERSYILAHSDMELDAETIQQLDEQVERRAKHEPLAYIRGKSEFYGREFLVNEHTLEPRPETETMVELARQITDNRLPVTVADIGTGSGCIGITMKLERPNLEVIGTDISNKCIEIAEKNAKNLEADVRFYQGNLLEPILETGDSRLATKFVILANLPYVPNDFTINQAAMQEPKLAIFGGVDGLDYYRQLFEQLESSKFKVQKPNYVLTEALPFQHHALATIARKYGYTLEKTDDFIQLFALSSPT